MIGIKQKSTLWSYGLRRDSEDQPRSRKVVPGREGKQGEKEGKSEKGKEEKKKEKKIYKKK